MNETTNETTTNSTDGAEPFTAETAPARLTVCTGTTCYVMGAAELIDEIQTAMEAGTCRVRLAGSPCLGYCKHRSHRSAPFVTVNDEVLEGASVERINALLERQTVADDGSTTGAVAGSIPTETKEEVREWHD